MGFLQELLLGWLEAVLCLDQSRVSLQRYPSNPGSSLGMETRLGDAEESSHPFCDEQSAWIMSVCSCQGSSGRGAFVWNAGGMAACRRNAIVQDLGKSGREMLGESLPCFPRRE